MGSMQTVLLLCINNYRRWLANPRVYVLFILIGLFVSNLTRPALNFSLETGVATTPWIVPFMLADFHVSIIFLVGVVLLFCDAPFINDLTPYECVRSGKMCWLAGQLLYLFTASMIYVLFLNLACLISLLPNLGLSAEWGSIITTFARTNADLQYASSFAYSYTILQTYQPLSAVAISSLLLFFEALFIGLTMFIINLTSKRTTGVVVGIMLALLPSLFVRSGEYWMFHLAPTTWSNLSMLDITGVSAYPSLAYALSTLLFLCVVLIVLAASRAKKCRSI